MNPRVRRVLATSAHKLIVEFTNSEVGMFDCAPLLGFGVFSELQDLAYFRKVHVVGGTVAWPNEQDICPDTLYLDSVRGPEVRLMALGTESDCSACP